MSQKIETKGRLTEGQLIALSMWCIGHYFAMGVSNSYFSYFLTDIVLMPAGDMGTLMFIVRLLSVITVPLQAALFQNWWIPFGKKHGKYRMYVWVFAPMVSVLAVLNFVPLYGASRATLFIYYFLMYFLFYRLYGFPQSAFQPMMARVGTANDTPRVTGHRAIFASVAAVIFSAALSMFKPIRQSGKASSWLLFAGGLALAFAGVNVIWILLFGAFFGAATALREVKKHAV